MFIGDRLGNPTWLGAGEVLGLRPCRMPIARLHRWELLPLAHTPTASRIEGDEVFGVALRFAVSSIPIEANRHDQREKEFRLAGRTVGATARDGAIVERGETRSSTFEVAYAVTAG